MIADRSQAIESKNAARIALQQADVLLDFCLTDYEFVLNDE